MMSTASCSVQLDAPDDRSLDASWAGLLLLRLHWQWTHQRAYALGQVVVVVQVIEGLGAVLVDEQRHSLRAVDVATDCIAYHFASIACLPALYTPNSDRADTSIPRLGAYFRDQDQ